MNVDASESGSDANEFCRVAESHPKDRRLREKPWRSRTTVSRRFEDKKCRPDSVVLVDDGHGPDDTLRLVDEIRLPARRREGKKSIMITFRVPGVNDHVGYDRPAFAKLTKVHRIQSDFTAPVSDEFDRMIAHAAHR